MSNGESEGDVIADHERAIEDVIISALATSGKSHEIFKSSTDKAEYEYIKLSNGLQVPLISDESFTNTAVSLSVYAGSVSDPKEVQGLAHLLEHVIDGGNEKYPEPDSLFELVFPTGGDIWGQTSLHMTTYGFDCEDSLFLEALDRFAHQFINPLLKEEIFERSIQSVDDEFAGYKHDDFWRCYLVLSFICDKRHPCHNFNIGNKESLSNIPIKNGVNLKDSLTDFFQSYSCFENLYVRSKSGYSLLRVFLLFIVRFEIFEM